MSGVHRRLPLLLLLGVTALSFGRAVRFPFLNWDDHTHVVTNPLIAHPLVQGLRALLLTAREGYPEPVTVLSYTWHRLLFGPGPLVFHLVNLLLHLLNIGLAQAVFTRLGASRRAAWTAAALFALHPLVTEPVCWVTGRKDLLAATLILAALRVLLGAAAAQGQQVDGPSLLRWTGAQLLGAAAMLAKPSALIAPLLLLLVTRHRYPHLGLRRALATLAPLGAMADALAVLGFRGEAAVGAVARRSFAEASADVLGALALQVKHLAWPRDLLAAYYRQPGDPSLPLVASCLLLLALVIALCVRFTRRGSPARLGLLLAGCAYLPVAGVVGLQRWVADSYAYLPLLGLSLALACLVEQLWPVSLARVARPATLALAGALSLLSFVQTDSWSSSSTLWSAVAARYPEHPNAQARLALAHYFEGDRELAARQLRELHRRHPDYDRVLYQQSWAFARAGEPALAARLLQQCVRLREPDCLAHCDRAARVGRPAPGCP